MEEVPHNLLEIDNLVDLFVKNHALGIETMHRTYFHNNDPISVRAIVSELTDELRTGCTSFFNKNDTIDGLNSYLFYIANSFCKKRSLIQTKKKTEYICPACLFKDKEVHIYYMNNLFKCESCNENLKTSSDPKSILLYKTFSKHNKIGYHCFDCDRFIPQPLDNSTIVSCPYLDCCFVGDLSSLKKMHHPSVRFNPEKIILDATQDCGKILKDNIPCQESDALSKMEIKEELENKIILLRNIIDCQSGNVPYSSSDFTVKHKLLVYQAFDNLLQKYPNEMVDYLLNQSRSGGFQHRVFQEYIVLLESSLPYNIKKGNKLHKIDNLLDDTLCLFDGISVFNSIITDKLEIKNNTQEYYIGGRKASYAKPFYIGKLLNIIDKNNEPIMHKVKEYSFSKIKMTDIIPGTEVSVTHLRIPPHYQMGGMVYVNRIRKKIVDRANFILNKESNEQI